ncbi:UTP--glucose-1-phosphate uridylyltransferase [Alkalihalobacterium chitinilyticum]|uniref:UTP--glucose-1-phosphate uridylyltransferase n=1 Tax=Alkalihalobacterium chitinilyticum TaxID=2980103 RepID=A0ABT5VEQ7_9BACI|nr:UTP--glucose-1-phosphate uridylyltransferase [Alkalihalobacterium chitinilyticum]MDE5412694.1 UTP--glucose-1-phosphate uridylyltransferase [Alkalihalobacterium chitinilyticum]
MRVKKAIIPAAGYGTRSLPITKVLPKEMFPINNKPAIHYVVEEAVAAGIEEILIVVSRNKNMIIDYFDRSLELEAFLVEMNKQHLLDKLSVPNVHIQFVRQPFARGLGDAIAVGSSFINNEPFAVLLPDDIFIEKKISLRQLINVYEKTSSSVIGVQQVKKEFLKNYGVIKEKEISPGLHEIIDIVEKPRKSPPSNLAVVGRYVLHPDIFMFLKQVKLGIGGEIQLTDALKDMLQQRKCYGYEVSGERYDIGSNKDYYRLLKKMNGELD